MNATRRSILLCLVIVALDGCAAQRYRAAPISPSESEARLENRSLQDPELRQYLEKNVGRQLTAWPPKSWDLGSLTFAAFYFSPEMELARVPTTQARAA